MSNIFFGTYYNTENKNNREIKYLIHELSAINIIYQIFSLILIVFSKTDQDTYSFHYKQEFGYCPLPYR